MSKNVPNKINQFELYTHEPNTVHRRGFLYTYKINFSTTRNEYKSRQVSVYLPSNYNFFDATQRFPVLYMFDGNNLFDDYQSFAGEWHADETVEYLKSKKVFKGLIVVGLDCPGNEKDREREMDCFKLPHIKEATQKISECYGEILGEFMVKTIKPLIDKTFHTYPGRKYTAIGGSSMGGLMSFYCALEYPKVFSKCLSFSPAFGIYKTKPYLKYLSKRLEKVEDLGKIYFFNGDQELDSFLKKAAIDTYELMSKKGYTKDEVTMLFDSRCKHHESEWAKYMPDALEWLFKND